jgi:hypothetical protein
MVTVREVVSKKELGDFIRFPNTLYKDCPVWVPPLDFDETGTLDKTKNPAFDFCRAKYWLARRDGKIVGRIAGIINDRYIEIWKHKYARFGWVDFTDDAEVSSALFAAVENWARENGMEGMQGPLGFTDFDKEGMLVEGFDEMGTIAGIYNYPYYPQHMDRLGYAKDADWLEFRMKLAPSVPEKLERMSRIVEKRLRLKVIRLRRSKDVLPYAKEIFAMIIERHLNNALCDWFDFAAKQGAMNTAYFPYDVFSATRLQPKSGQPLRGGPPSGTCASLRLFTVRASRFHSRA